MDLVALFIVALIAIEHVGIGAFEIFGNTQAQAKAFDMPEDFVSQKNAKTALANQGIYNAMLGILTLVFILIFPIGILRVILTLMMLFIVIVAIFGGFTVNKKILLMQGLPALIGLILVFFFYR
ncbi:DUF1304 domain-containing protein [Companilactobacillus mishanensis]|uniref:DUF1304 domain-containing protein n=1 Tax=Companilactobacillus mishanensis TaxID=2486008 RepID=A0A5P0ZHS0_9LACO|nr:DUF1304 domain-containing protein [Companilactobacillus mishanensis]MQS52610.1 DUF1304 domain-containing protein [Companilactobacillus mishanensis]MQS90198.1 DUF1304 domain-containing protein [Companilactobacillus mishanensis]